MTQHVPYKLGERTVLITDEDAAAIENDRRLYGNCFVGIGADGHGIRLDPKGVTFRATKSGDAAR